MHLVVISFVIGADRCRLWRIGVVVAVSVDNCCLYVCAECFASIAGTFKPEHNIHICSAIITTAKAGGRKKQPTNTRLSARSVSSVWSALNRIIAIKCHGVGANTKHPSRTSHPYVCVTYDRTKMWLCSH